MSSPASTGPEDPPPGAAEPAAGRVERLRGRAHAASERYEARSKTRPLLGLPLTFVARYHDRQGVLLASAIGFRLFLWLLPLALFIAGIMAGLAVGDGRDVSSAAKTAGITGAASQEVVTALREGHRSWWTAVLTGGVLLVWTSRTLMRSLILVNAHAWQVPLVKRRHKDILLTTIIMDAGWLLLLAVAAAIARLNHVIPLHGVLGGFVQGVAAAGVWLLICIQLPDSRSSWIDLIPGSLMFGFGLAILHAVSRIYIPGRLARSSELYGSLGIALVILAWLLIIGQVIVSAALANSVWADFRRNQ